jgi:hypothetical protein
MFRRFERLVETRLLKTEEQSAERRWEVLQDEQARRGREKDSVGSVNDAVLSALSLLVKFKGLKKNYDVQYWLQGRCCSSSLSSRDGNRRIS